MDQKAEKIGNDGKFENNDELNEKEKAARDAFLAHKDFVSHGGDLAEVSKRGREVLEKIEEFKNAGGKWDPFEQMRKGAEEKKQNGNGGGN